MRVRDHENSLTKTVMEPLYQFAGEFRENVPYFDGIPFTGGHVRRTVLVAVACAFAVGVLGCNRVSGDKYADKIHEKMMARIKSGKIKNYADIDTQKEEVVREALKDMGFNPDSAKITQSEQKKLEEKLKKYADEWRKAIDEQSRKG